MESSGSAHDWPQDADGDVLRRLAARGFDFSRDIAIDFNVDFDEWPPAPEALELLRASYGALELFEPFDGSAGYILFQVIGRVSYESITAIQRDASSAMRPFGGICESWGVLG